MIKDKRQPVRESILDVVFKLVYTHKYNDTSMSMILKESLYHYFKSKKEVLLAVIKERLHPQMDEFYDLKLHF